MIVHVRKEFRDLVSKDQARDIIDNLDIAAELKVVEISEAYGRTLAEDVISQIDVPPFTRSSMDGYAVCASDTYMAREDRPICLKIKGSIQAGINPNFSIEKDETSEIATGAVMPEGADSVVMVEYTNIDKSDPKSILIYRPVSINENIMQAGSDIMAGERVLREGTHLGQREIGVLCAIGKHKVSVLDLKVGIISTGNELKKPGCELSDGEIYDVNSFSLACAVRECGGTPVHYGNIKDNELDIKKALKELSNCNIILTSGSTSAGSGDMMYRIIEENGVILVHGIDIKPGKPAIIGKIFERAVFGLPGYPASALTIFNEFIAPVIRKRMDRLTKSLKVKAKAALRIHSDGRNQLLPVGLIRGLAYPIEKGSGAITTLSEADGYIDILPEVEIIDAGEDVEVTLYGEVDNIDLFFVGSHCFGIDAIVDASGLKMKIINTGSSGGLSAVKKGIADIAGVHLLDESGYYNMPFLKRFGIYNAVLVKGYLREQGLIIRNDSNITKFEDVVNSRFINRNTGSGTRVMTDIMLKNIAEKQGISFIELTKKIKGYNTEAKTHSAVAASVKLKKADAGIGIRAAAELNGLKFIKISDEEYDFVIPVNIIESSEIKKFIKSLTSEEISSKLPSGIKTYARTGEILKVDP